MKIGLFFGSFNPVHIGHVAVADYIVEHTDVEEIWFVVSPQNPFKQSASLLVDDERLKMVAMAIAGHKKIKTCDVEFTLPKPSYTIDTIHYLKNQYPENEFVVIMGEDNLTRFDQWKDYDKIL